MPQYPQIRVQLSGQDGNVFAVIGSVERALKRVGLRTEAAAFSKAALEQDSYDSVLRLCMRTVSVA